MAAVAMGALSAASGIMTGYGQYQEGKYQSKVASANAEILRQNAARKRLETSINEDRMREQNRRQVAQNVAASVEQGMGNSATTVGVIGQQMTDLEQNALDIRYEGLSAAENLDIQADYTKQQGKWAKRQGKNAFTMSLITSPISFAKGYNSF